MKLGMGRPVLLARRSLVLGMLTVIMTFLGFTAQGQSVFIVTNPPVSNDTIRICEGDEISYEATTFGYGTPTTYLWNFGGGTPGSALTAGPHLITYNTTGTFSTTVAVSDGTNNFNGNITVIVGALPTGVTWTPAQTSFCSSDGPVVLSDGSPAGGVYSGPGVINGVFYPDSAGAGTHNICYTYTAPNGCSASDCALFTLAPGPDASIEDQNVFTPFVNCIPAGGTPTYTLQINNSSSTSATNTSYWIDWGDGSTPYSGVTLPNGTSHTYTTVGNFVITVVVTSANGCVDTTTYDFYNGQNPNVGIGIGASRGCIPFTLNVPILNTAGNPPGTQYNLSFGDGTVMTFTHPPPPSVMYTYTSTSCGSTDLLGNPNSYYIQLTATTPCGSSQALALPIELSQAPTVNLEATDSSICVGQSVGLEDLSDSAFYVSGGPDCSTNYTRNWVITPATGWTIDNPGSADPNITFQDTGVYEVCLAVGHPCGNDTACIQICVGEEPEIDMQASVSGVCAPVELTLTNNSVFYNGCHVTEDGFTWSGGNWDSTWFTIDSISGDTVWHFVFNDPGSYGVEYYAVNECDSVFWNYNFEVGDPPNVSFPPDRIYCDLQTIDFGSTGPGGSPNRHRPSIDDNNNGITSYQWFVTPPTGWQFVNGTGPGDQFPVIEFTDTGTFVVCLAVTNECGTDTACQTITISDGPDFDISPDTTICYGGDATLWIYNLSGYPPFDISWRTVPNSGFSSSDDTITVTGITSTTTYRATVTDSLGCESSQTVTVIVADDLDVDAGADMLICSTDSFNLSGSISGGTPPYTYYWSPGSLLNDSTILNPRAGMLTGDTSFVLAVIDSLGCIASDVVSVSIHQPPLNVDTGPDTTYCNSPYIETLQGSPPGGAWTGPGVVPPNGFDPSLAGNGSHTLVYTYTDNNGCTGEDSVVITVVDPVIPIALPDTVVCEGSDPIQLSGIPFGGTWTISSNPGLLSDSVFDPATAGSYDLYYTIGSGSCEATDTITIDVMPGPDPGGPFEREICSGDSILFTPSADVAGSTAQWTSSAGGNITGNTASGSGTIADTLFNTGNDPDTVVYIIRATGPAPTLCPGDTTTLTVIVNPRPSITNALDTFEVCSGENFTFTPISNVSGSTFNHNHISSDPGITGATSGSGSISDILSNNGSASGWVHYQVFAVGPNPADCAGDTFDVYVLVHPLPDVDAGPDLNYCSGDSIQLQSVIPTGVTWVWSPVSGLSDPTAAQPYIAVTNTGSSDLVLTYVITAIDTITGCVNRDTLQVTVHPNPVVDPGPDHSICIGDTTTIGTPGDPDYSYNWTVPGGSFTAGTATVTVSPDTTTTYQLVQTHLATGCTDSALVTVTVIPAPVAGFIATPDSGCSPLNISLTDTSTAGVNHEWYVNGVLFSNLPNPNLTLTNTSGTVDSVYTITLVITAGSGCIDSASQDVVVFPLPDAGFTLPTPLCAPDSITATQTGSYTLGTTYQWGVSSPTVSVYGSTDSIASFVFPDFQGGADSTYIIWLVATSPNGCTDSVSQTVTIYARPTAGFTLPASTCGPTDVTVNNGASGSGLTYSYSVVPSTGVSMDDPNDPQPVISFPASTADSVVYTVYQSVTDDRGCTDIDSAQYVIYPGPTAGFVASQTDSCGPLTVQFTNTSSPNQSGQGLNDLSFEWDLGNGTTSTAVHPNAVYTNSGTSDTGYVVTLIATNAIGCTDTVSDTVTVHPDPLAQFTGLPQSACAPFTIDTSVVSVDLFPGANDQYIWEVVDPVTGIVLQSFSNPDGLSYTITGSDDSVLVRLIATSAFGCANDTADMIFRTIANPVAGFIAAPDSGCSPLNVALTDTSTAGVTHQWYLNGVPFSTSQNPNISLTNSSNAIDSIYTITLVITAGSGCIDSASQDVVVFAAPVSGFTATEVCYGEGTVFMDASSSTVGIVDWQWDFGDGNSGSGSNPTHNYTTPGSYAVELTVTDARGCNHSYTDSVVINAQPVADFTVTTCGTDTLCADVPTVFVSTSSAASPGGSIISWAWDVDGDGVTDYTTDSISHVFTGSGNAIVQLIVETESGCRDTIQYNYFILSPPAADFILDVNEGCGPLQVNATNQSSGTITAYAWSVYALDNQGNRVVLHTSNSAGSGSIPPFQSASNNDTTYYIELVVSNCCGTDTLTRSVTVHTSPVAGLLPDNDDGCSPFSVEFQLDGRVNGTPDFIIMDYGDGVVDTIYPQILVLPGGDTTLIWGIQNHNFIYNGSGVDTTYIVTQYAVNTCGTDTASVPIIVRANTVNAFIDASPRSGCAPLTVTFANASFQASNYSWCLDYDTVTGMCSQPAVGDTVVYTYTQPGIYTAALFVEDGCSYDTAYVTITVYANPVASFTAGNECVSDSVQFANTSTISSGSINSYTWNFGDGNTSFLTNPRHLYATPGVYNVTLVVSSANGCTDTATQSVTVYPGPQVDFDPVQLCLNEQPFTFQNNTDTISSVIVSTSWDFGDGNTSTQFEPSHQYAAPGSYTVRLIHTTANGCIDSATRVVDILPVPVAGFTAALIAGDQCGAPQTWAFTNTSTGADTYQWDFDLDNPGTWTDNRENPTFTYNQTGIFRAGLIATSTEGCADTTELTIEIPPYPVAYFVLDSSYGCVPHTVTFTDSSVYNFPGSITARTWDMGDGTIITGNQGSVTHTYTVSGNYTVSLIVETDRGCIDTLTTAGVVQVYPRPEAAFTYQMNSDGTVQFINQSQNTDADTEWHWDFGDGNTSSEMNPVHSYDVDRYEQDYFFTVCLRAGNNYGCPDSTCLSVELLGYLLVVPNAFAPDLLGVGDGNVFLPKGNNIAKYELRIFDAYGNLVFKTTELTPESGIPAVAWDGTFMNGGADPLPSGAYVWKINAMFIDGAIWRGKKYKDGRVLRFGTVTLIR